MNQPPTAIAEKRHVSRTPGVCGGRPCIVGTRIRVQDVYVWHELQGHTPDEIITNFPQLSLADVYAALAYFWDHRDELLEQMKREEASVEQLRLKHPSKLAQRLRSKGDGDALSS